MSEESNTKSKETKKGKTTKKGLPNTLKDNIEKKRVSSFLLKLNNQIDSAEKDIPKSKLGEILKNLDIGKVDFSLYSIDELAGSWKGDDLVCNKDGVIIPHKESIIGKLSKMKCGGSLAKEIMLTMVISKAKNTLYAKYAKRKKTGNTNEKVSEEEVNWTNRQEQFAMFSKNIQPGDMIFFVDWGRLKWYEKVLQRASSFPAQHVGLIGESKPSNLYHSTIKKWADGRNGVKSVDLKSEIEQRHPPLKLLIVRPNWKKSIINKVIAKSKKLKQEKVKFSILDALTSILRLGNIDKALNCGTFVNECYKASPLYENVKNAGVPANLMKWKWFTAEYFIEYK